MISNLYFLQFGELRRVVDFLAHLAARSFVTVDFSFDSDLQVESEKSPHMVTWLSNWPENYQKCQKSDATSVLQLLHFFLL